MKSLGLDIGSTTIKCVVIDENNNIIFNKYERHRSKIHEVTIVLLKEVIEKYPDDKFYFAISGSAGMGLADSLKVLFIQEVYATKVAITKQNIPASTVIELGGEDAKIIFLSGGFEMRMNGTCAGGTGAFIDQMASLMNVDPIELNDLAKQHEKIYTIASRCGVFAKSDIQPLLNQGARKEDISASIFYAVVNQTIAGLAQGRKIEGDVIYLGGPLTFFSELRLAFDDVLKIKGNCPDNSLYFVSLGAAISANGEEVSLIDVINKLTNQHMISSYNACAPLFNDSKDYDEFVNRHKQAGKGIIEKNLVPGNYYLGIDAGSTTVKLLLIDNDNNIYKPFYTSNSGNPIPIVKNYLFDLYANNPGVKIIGSCVTGYGEEMIKNAFHIDLGVVETIAHFTAAKEFKHDVDFILDIGGQDIKCFKIHNGAIDSIYLNEACSSGCGSFLQTFASALGYSVEEFTRMGIYAKKPVDLGSRCTVFMNSSVKQAQKDGATIDNIAAGLAISVVKNALYKVIRCSSANQLGNNIVVQGGTFLNDLVLRAFEKEIGHNVIRPHLAGLMGAFGCALYAKKHITSSSIIDMEGLKNFTHEVKAITCKGCSNNCRLTINRFNDGGVFIAGNRCDKPLKIANKKPIHDLYKDKLDKILSYQDLNIDHTKKTIGIPLGLNMYELLPFWYTFYKELGFNVVISDLSNHSLYLKGQYTIPSDTICYPAKLIHGHIMSLLEKKVDYIFYPNMSYNIDEKKGSNHYNCPVVAYYPQVIKDNVNEINQVKYICDFISLHDEKEFIKHINKILNKYFPMLKKHNIVKAAKKAYAEYHNYMDFVVKKGQEYINYANKENMPIIVLCGRPYHIDPEINHGISNLICKLDAVVITEDSVASLVDKVPTQIMNQWTYHARLYQAAKFVSLADNKKVNLVQLVSFGCGVDAITTDEVRRIVEETGHVYTQIKIDEISNMGAVKIRLRSLFAAMEE